MLDLLLNTAFLRLDMTTRSLSNFAAAMLIGKIVYFYIIVLPVSKRNLDAENRTRLLRSLYPKNYYFGMLCGLTVALCSFDLGRWWYASMGVMIFLTEASGRVYFHPQTVRYKKELESMSPEEKIASGLPAKARKLKMRRIAVNIGTVVLGFFSITQLFR